MQEMKHKRYFKEIHVDDTYTYYYVFVKEDNVYYLRNSYELYDDRTYKYKYINFETIKKFKNRLRASKLKEITEEDFFLDFI